MEKDIIFRLSLLKDNIKLVEEDKNNKVALNIVRNTFIEVFEDIKVFLISRKDRYYGYFLMNLKLEIDFYSNIVAGVSMNTEPFTLVCNPLILGKYKVKEIIFIICHEIEHIILNHPYEGMKMIKNGHDHFKLNIAMDCSVNDRLVLDCEKNSRLLSLPEDVYTSKVLTKEFNLTGVNTNENFLYYYQLIKDKKSDNDEEEEAYSVVLSKDGSVITDKDARGCTNHKWVDSDLAEDVGERIKQFVGKVYDSISEESRGLLPAYQLEALKAIVAPPKISWEKVLKKYIGMIPIPYKKTKMRLNRRQPERYDIPGRINDRTIRVVVAIDTSGSMSSKMLENVFTEIFQILRKVKFELTVIECDAEIGRIYKARSMADINLEVTGRGGTSFVPVIDYINESGTFRDAVLVYFTDGWGDIEIPKPKTYRNLWVVLGNKDNLSLNNPYGEVLEMELNDEDMWDDI